MRPSFGKKVKLDDSDSKFKEKIYRSIYPSPCSSYNPNKWLQNNDISWLSHSLEQDIDKILKIAIPQPMKPQNNRRASANDIREEIDDKLLKQKRNTQYVEKQHEDLPKNSKLKINMSSIICEFPIQKVQRQSNSDYPKTPNCQKSFMEAIISRYQQKNEQDEQLEKEKQYLFQNNNKEQIIDPNVNKNAECDNVSNEEQQSISTNDVTSIKQTQLKEIKPKKISKQKKSQVRKPKKKQRQKKKQQRIYPLPQSTQTELYQEKTKYTRPPQTIESPLFNTKQCWARMQYRKEARKYEEYQTKEFQDLLKYIPNFYIHKCEGEIKIGKIQKKGEYICNFEILINPLILIGPIKMNGKVKLYVRYKKYNSGQVFCDNKLQATLPQNKVEVKAFEKEKIILANNTNHKIRLICFLVNIPNQAPKKRCK